MTSRLRHLCTKILTPRLYIVIFFTVVFCLISLVNHYFFRTNALDLGMYNNALYDYAHFRKNECTLLFDFKGFNILGCDHFALLIPLFSPLYWVLGQYTLLLIQIFSVIVGGLGAYKYIKYLSKDETLSNIALVFYYSIWGVYSALSYDYHDNVVGTMLVPWLVLFTSQRKYLKATLIFFLIIISKENTALWASFICLGLLINNFKAEKKYLLFTFSLSAVAILYFIIVIKVVMPSMQGDGWEFSQIKKYSCLGNSFSDIFKTLITQPQHVFKLLYTNHTSDPAGDNIKQELYYMFFMSGGLCLIFRPGYLFMLIPILGQKVFADEFVKWGINYQYSIEFVPILTLALFESLLFLNKAFHQKIIASICVLSTIIVTYKSLSYRDSKWFDPNQINFLSKEHYTTYFDAGELHKLIKDIPSELKVSAQNCLVPHLAFRDKIYRFPDILDADMLIIMPQESPYPFTKEEQDLKITQLLNSKDWDLICNKGYVLIFKKIIN